MLRKTELGAIYLDELETPDGVDAWAIKATKQRTVEVDNLYGGKPFTYVFESISPDPEIDSLEYVLRAQRNCPTGVITLDTRFTSGFTYYGTLVDEFSLEQRDIFFYRTSNHPYLDRYVDLRQFINQLHLQHYVNKNEIKRLLGDHAQILVVHDGEDVHRCLVLGRKSFDSFIYDLSRPPYSSKGFFGFYKSGFAHNIKSMMHLLNKHSNW